MIALRDILCRRDGNIAVEVALATPVLLIALAGTFDYGRAVLTDMRLKAAVRAGLEYAQINPDDAANIVAVVRTAAGDATLPVTSAQVCQCADGTTLECTSTCSSGLAPGAYIVVSAQQSFTPVFSAMTRLVGDSVRAQGSIRAK
ncbi:TadE/TadG family type IV pilus assembly protein [Desertibaculum subflavum]|uniref:TadE/TadG family type IV pilus assembly protein n=1 Tax=Desertibaculum subflavum TaxID=2268458 RepID=UPI000E66EB9F